MAATQTAPPHALASVENLDTWARQVAR